MIEEQQFDLAVGLILSYYFEGSTDEVLPKIFRLIAEVCPAACDRIMVLAAALKTEGFDERYGLADPGDILRTFETTADFREDVDRFLDLLRQADESAELEARIEATVFPDNPYREQAKAFINRFGLNATRTDLDEFLARREQ